MKRVRAVQSIKLPMFSLVADCGTAREKNLLQRKNLGIRTSEQVTFKYTGG